MYTKFTNICTDVGKIFQKKIYSKIFFIYQTTINDLINGYLV